MQYCRHCGEKLDEDLASCPGCGEVLIELDTQWQKSRIEEKIEGAKDRANMYIILATVLATVGILGAGLLLCFLASLLGLFGIVLVCLGIGCTAAAQRHERKASSLQKQASR